MKIGGFDGFLVLYIKISPQMHITLLSLIDIQTCREAMATGAPQSFLFTLWAAVVGVAVFAAFQVSAQVMQC